MGEQNTPRTLSSVENTLEIIDAMDTEDGVRIMDLAEQFDLSKGSIHTHLATLRKHGYVIKTGDRYCLSHKLLQKGNAVRCRTDLYRAGYEPAKKLADETGENVLLMIEEFGYGINIHGERGPESIADDWLTQKLGIRVPLHVNAPGKSILAHLPEDRVEQIVNRIELSPETKNTITTKADLLNELETIRKRGYALNDEEEDYGFRAVGAPVIDEEGTVLGGISVSGPVSRMDQNRFTETLPEKVSETTNVIEINHSIKDELYANRGSWLQ